MRVGLMGAMQEEVELLKSDIVEPHNQTIGKREYISGTLYGKDVVLVFSRWGKVASASTATTLIDAFHVDALVFSGVAGAASSELSFGDIVVGNRFIQHDMDASALPDLKKFEIPLLGVSCFYSDEILLEAAKSSADGYLRNELSNEIDPALLTLFGIVSPKVSVGSIASGDVFLSDAAVIRRLADEIGDLKCVEMEGAAVAQVCYEHSVPFVVCRSISDKADHSAEFDFPMYVSQIARYYSRGIIKNLLRKI